MSPGSLVRRLAPVAMAALVVGVSAGETLAYQATVDVNDSAFGPPCLSFHDTYPEKMLAAAAAGFSTLGYPTTTYTGAAFTKAQTLARAVTDDGFYVHSHGDYYWYSPESRRYSGFREDSGDCTQQVVFSNEIQARRAGRLSNLIFISTCHLADATTTMPAAFAIDKAKAGATGWLGPKFYVSYLGSAWDSDEWLFERAFWDQLRLGRATGVAFDTAMLSAFGHSDFDADWWGSYSYSGKPGPQGSCKGCS